MHLSVFYISCRIRSVQYVADIRVRVSETDTWHLLKDSKRIGSKILKMRDAYWIRFIVQLASRI